VVSQLLGEEGAGLLASYGKYRVIRLQFPGRVGPGTAMGFDVWVARNDKSRVDTQALGGRLKESLPRQFDDATNRTIEHIDVLWLKRNSIEAAFEIEHTTSI
jgi:hypothetical protein